MNLKRAIQFIVLALILMSSNVFAKDRTQLKTGYDLYMVLNDQIDNTRFDKILNLEYLR